MICGLYRAALSACLAGVAAGATLQDLGKYATEFQLPNGMKFAVVERRESPLVAFHLVVKAGIADEPTGKSGIARLFEKMYQHGGEITGSRNAASERSAINRVEQLFDKWKEVDSRNPPADPVDVSKARVEHQMAVEQSFALGNPYFLRRVFEANGASGALAAVEADSSTYAVTVPSHRAEVWFKAVGDWLRKPSPRFFYQERDTWRAERARLMEATAQLRLESALASAAFPNHGYSRFAANLAETETLRVADFEKFAQTYYTPGNTVVAVVGDIAPAEARRLATAYFGSIPSAPAPPLPPETVLAIKDDQVVSVALPIGAAPPVALAWRRPARTDPDDAVFDVIWGILMGGGEMSLERALTADKIAATAGVLPSFPGDRLPGVFAISAVPLRAVALADVENTLARAVGKLRTGQLPDNELVVVKAKLESRFVSETERPAGMAGLVGRFLAYGASGGGMDAIAKAWRQIENVTPADIQRVASKYLVEKGRLVVQSTQGAD